MPVVATITGRELEMPPKNYGHLIGLTARYARFRLDGHTVVNRQTGMPIVLAWSRGLDKGAAPGTPPALLLAIPAIPTMLAAARYLGAFPPQPPHPYHVLRYHAFASAVAIGAHRLDVVLIVREDRQGRFFFDRMLAPDPPPLWLEGWRASDDNPYGRVMVPVWPASSRLGQVR